MKHAIIDMDGSRPDPTMNRKNAMHINTLQKTKPMDSMVMAGLPIAVIYWVLDSILNIFFYNKYNVLAELFGPDLYEIYTRLVVLSLLLFFGSHAQSAINQLKTARDSMHRSEAAHRAFIENLNVGIFRSTLDPEGRFIRINPALVDIFAYPSQEDFMQTTVSDHFLHPAELHEFISDLAESRVINGREFQLKNYNGRTFWASFSAAIKTNAGGNARFMDAAVEDISQRKKAEEALRTSEEKYRQLVNYAPAGIYEVDLSTADFVRVNDVLCELTGYSREELLKMKCYEILTQESKRVFFERLVELFEGDMSRESEEFTVRKKNGETMWVAIHTRYHYQFDKPTSATVVLHDINRIKHAEKEKRRLEQQLYRARKMEAIGTLAGGVAHDFNNLLMAMQGHVSLMMSKGADPQTYGHHLQTVENHIKSAADLTAKLLSFAKGGNFERRPTCLNELTREQIQLFGRTRKDIRIHEQYEARPWMADVDPVQFKQVLLNMIVNALQAMPGGGDLHIGTRNIDLENRAAAAADVEPGKYVRLHITDSGTGMDAATRRRVFEPFFTTRKYGAQKGTGLGLAVAYGIIKNHGGFVTVSSEPGTGATFHLYFPVSEQRVRPPTSP
jgi:PAS domain S-box-containing protein